MNMEREFKVKDRVRVISNDRTHKGKEGVISFVDNNTHSTIIPYLVEFEPEGKDWKWFDERHIALVEPERKYKYQKADKVWHKNHQKAYLFIEHHDENKVILMELSQVIQASESDIEPYYYQDLEAHIQNARDVKKENVATKPTHPYTVILKSGVKVGISATIFDYITEQNSDTKSVQTVADGTIVLSEIAAIVPSENIK